MQQPFRIKHVHDFEILFICVGLRNEHDVASVVFHLDFGRNVTARRQNEVAQIRKLFRRNGDLVVILAVMVGVVLLKKPQNVDKLLYRFDLHGVGNFLAVGHRYAVLAQIFDPLLIEKHFEREIARHVVYAQRAIHIPVGKRCDLFGGNRRLNIEIPIEQRLIVGHVIFDQVARLHAARSQIIVVKTHERAVLRINDLFGNGIAE